MTFNINLTRQKIKIVSALVVLLIMASLIVTVLPLTAQQRLRLATTTSLYDTGLWGHLEFMFEEEYGVELDIMYAGTGKALEYGRRGDVDVVVVHSKASEEQFLAEDYGVERVPFAYNYFLILGPITDPANIKGMSPGEAFKKLMETGAGGFVSRGDSSGTHSKEKIIWIEAGYDYEVVRNTGAWYTEAGTGMGSTLMMASEKQAYTLTDMGTYLAYRSKLELVPLVDKGNILINVYSAIAINPEKVPETKIDMANNLIKFLSSPEKQEFIGGYGIEEFGTQLFIPCAGAEPK
ncbi:substrate-binding domain-containing protein [Chloroflexota bacterium]